MIKKNKGSRSWSRILAIQALYQLSLNKDAKVNEVIKNFTIIWIKDDNDNQEIKNRMNIVEEIIGKTKNESLKIHLESVPNKYECIHFKNFEAVFPHGVEKHFPD